MTGRIHPGREWSTPQEQADWFRRRSMALGVTELRWTVKPRRASHAGPTSAPVMLKLRGRPYFEPFKPLGKARRRRLHRKGDPAYREAVVLGSHWGQVARIRTETASVPVAEGIEYVWDLKQDTLTFVEPVPRKARLGPMFIVFAGVLVGMVAAYCVASRKR